MNNADDADYFIRREQQQRTLAERATNPAIAAIHLAMARQYAEQTRSTDAPSLKAVRD